MKRQFLADLEQGDAVDDVFFVLEAGDRIGSISGAPAMRLSDRSGTAGAFIRSGNYKDRRRISASSFIRVKGVTFSGGSSKVIEVRQFREEDVYKLSQKDFLPGSFRDPTEMLGFMEYFVDDLHDEDYRRLLRSFLDDSCFIEMFCLAPGEIRSHHAYLGGLLEHTVSVTTLCQHLCVQHPRIDQEMLVTAALLHDIGKVEEFSWQGRFEFTDQGMLWGHVLLGQRMVERRISHTGGMPADKQLGLLHAIASHHGEPEWGAPRQPMSAEALALHHVDNLDAKLKGYLEVVEGGRDLSWTELNNLFRRPLSEPLAADRAFRR